jgi:hypothetical protein
MGLCASEKAFAAPVTIELPDLAAQTKRRGLMGIVSDTAKQDAFSDDWATML